MWSLRQSYITMVGGFRRPFRAGQWSALGTNLRSGAYRGLGQGRVRDLRAACRHLARRSRSWPWLAIWISTPLMPSPSGAQRPFVPHVGPSSPPSPSVWSVGSPFVLTYAFTSPWQRRLRAQLFRHRSRLTCCPEAILPSALEYGSAMEWRRPDTFRTPAFDHASALIVIHLRLGSAWCGSVIIPLRSGRQSAARRRRSLMAGR
jgi:hypothetical protein